MEQVNRICRHPLWQKNVAEIAELEKDRVFCRHDIAHFLDVARIASIENLEQGLGIPKDWIYAAALLHDIGRHLQYLNGTPHDHAGAVLARQILADCGFAPNAQAEILAAVSDHRSEETKTAKTLAGVIYRADKASRACLFCPARAACNWSDEKKNMRLGV